MLPCQEMALTMKPDALCRDEALGLGSSSELCQAVVNAATYLCTWAQKRTDQKQRRMGTGLGQDLEPMYDPLLYQPFNL